MQADGQSQIIVFLCLFTEIR